MNIPIYYQYINQYAYNDDLNRVLVAGLSDNGWTFPQLTTAQITTVAPQMPNGTAWYDVTTDQPKIKVAGVVKVISTV